MYGCVPSLFKRNDHNIVNRPLPNTILKVQKKFFFCKEAAEGRDMGRDHRGIIPPTVTFIFLQGNYVRVRRGG